MAKYRFPKTAAKIVIEKHSPLVNRLLTNRGLKKAAEAEEFLSPNYETGLHDPRLLHDIGKAVKRIKQAIKKDEHIAIFSDYDCDGIPGAVVLRERNYLKLSRL
jgi:single-stranded-DNA-specific exonuclease